MLGYKMIEKARDDIKVVINLAKKHPCPRAEALLAVSYVQGMKLTTSASGERMVIIGLKDKFDGN